MFDYINRSMIVFIYIRISKYIIIIIIHGYYEFVIKYQISTYVNLVLIVREHDDNFKYKFTETALVGYIFVKFYT